MEKETTTRIKSKQDVLAYFETLQLNKVPKKRENWGIFVKGERIVLSNGKSLWSEKNHASSAMRNEWSKNVATNWYNFSQGSKFDEKLYREYLCHRDDIEKLYKQLKEEGVIEFRPV